MAKNPKCKVCGKPTNKECSHIACPNRKVISAAVPFYADEVTEFIIRAPGTSFKRPSNKE